MARRDDQTALLARVPLFSACSKKELQALAKRAEERRVPAGTAIVREGEAEVRVLGRLVGVVRRLKA